MSLSQYWPVAIVIPKGETPRLQYTYNSVHSLTKANEVFLNWQNNYGYILLATWVEERSDSGEKNIMDLRTYVNSFGHIKKLVIDNNTKEEPANVHTESY